MSISLFLPCAAGVETYLFQEVESILVDSLKTILKQKGGVAVHCQWNDALRLNLYSRLSSRVLLKIKHVAYCSEQDLYEASLESEWEQWFDVKKTFKVDITSRQSSLRSLHFAALKIKDGIVDRFRKKNGVRPNVATDAPQVIVFAHLSRNNLTLYLDLSGDPLFKRGWREDQGDAPLKETLAASLLAASGWSQAEKNHTLSLVEQGVPLYDPCCGSGTIAIEAAQIACGMAAGIQRKFAFEHLHGFVRQQWLHMREEAISKQHPPQAPIFASDISFRMVDFAQRNARNAKVHNQIKFRAGDALERQAPIETAGMLLLNPPYGERLDIAGFAGQPNYRRSQAYEEPQQTLKQQAPHSRYRQAFTSKNFAKHTQRSQGMEANKSQVASSWDHASVTESSSWVDDFYDKLAQHWKQHYPSWSAWILSPDRQLPSRMHFKESRKIPLWNGPIECRLFKFELFEVKR